MRPLYVSATKQDTGKTTTLIGLLEGLRNLGRNVGYMKPVGQRYVQYEGRNIDEDAVLAKEAFGLPDRPVDMSPVAIEQGFTEHYIFNRDPRPLEARILDAFGRLRASHDTLVIEGTGHAGVGSCFDLSNARVAELLGAAVIIVTEGGIGRAIDEVALSYHLFHSQGVPVLGVVLNKVLPEKQAKVERAVREGLRHMGTRLLAVVPYRPQLVYPRMEQIVAEVHGRVLCGEHALGNRIEHTVVAAMAPQHVCPYIRQNSLVITPGDRIDNILVSIISCPNEKGSGPLVAGIVLTGGFEPPPAILRLLDSSRIPVVICREDTYSVASRLREMRFKIRAKDTDKIEAAKALMGKAIDMPALMAALDEAGTRSESLAGGQPSA